MLIKTNNIHYSTSLMSTTTFSLTNCDQQHHRLDNNNDTTAMPVTTTMTATPSNCINRDFFFHFYSFIRYEALFIYLSLITQLTSFTRRAFYFYFIISLAISSYKCALRKFKKVNLMPKILTAEYVTWPVRTSGKKKAEVHMGSCTKYSLLRDWMSQIRAKVILFLKIELRTIRLPYPSLSR